MPAPARAPTSAAAAANTLLAFGRRERGFPVIDQMKLQKLLFYAHAWHLAKQDAPLFEEDFEAWPWGPVVRDIHNQTKRYERGEVTGSITEIGLKDGKPALSTPSVTNAALEGFLQSIWDAHKAFSGIQLSNATHLPGEPWTVMKETLPSLDDRPTMPNALIAEIFKRKLSMPGDAA